VSKNRNSSYLRRLRGREIYYRQGARAFVSLVQNNGIGYFEDDVQRMQSAMAYLHKYT
jgi:hypothetical protein